MTTTPTLRDAAQALAQLRHLYANLTNGGVRDTASAKRIADGLLSPAIVALERAALAAPADALAEPVEWQHRMGPTDSWQECTKEFHDWVLRAPREWPGSEVRALVDAAAIRAKGQQ